MLVSIFTAKPCSPATLILLEFGIRPQVSSGHNGGYLERWLDGDSSVIQPSCPRETKLSLTVLPSSDP